MAQFADSFTRPDAAAIGGAWTVLQGGFDIISNELRSNSGTYGLAHTTALDSTDMEASLHFLAVDNVSLGLVVRSNIGMGSYLLFRNDGTSWQIFDNVAGSFNAIGASHASALAAGDVVTLRAEGTLVQGLVNGVVRCSAAVSEPTADRVYAGIRLFGSAVGRYDDFLARDLATGVGESFSYPVYLGGHFYAAGDPVPELGWRLREWLENRGYIVPAGTLKAKRAFKYGGVSYARDQAAPTATGRHLKRLLDHRYIGL